MKYLFLLLIGAAVFAAEPAGEFAQLVKGLQAVYPEWKAQKAEPLEKTVDAPFAAGSWRIRLIRPLLGKIDGKLQFSEKIQSNSAEIIAVKMTQEYSQDYIRKHLKWENAPQEYFTAVSYSGRKGAYAYFTKADIGALSVVSELIGDKSSESLCGIAAQALAIKDLNEFSRRIAPSVLQKYGNAAIPQIRRAIGVALAANVSVEPHFEALKRIDTPESTMEIRRALRHKDTQIQDAAAAAFLQPPYAKNAKDIYLYLLSGHKILATALAAAAEYGWTAEFLPVMKRMLENPESFAEYFELAFAVRKFSGKMINDPEVEIIGRIQTLMLRSGDTSNSPQFVSLTEKAAERKVKLDREEEKRIAPLENAFLQSKDADCAIAAALSMALFKPSKYMFRDTYVRRVNAEGMKLLRRLPYRERIRAVLRSLSDNTDDVKESENFEELRNKF